MIKSWRIAWHEYSRHVFRKRFIFALLSMPLFLGAMVFLVILITWMESNPTPIGYIDHSGLLANPTPQPAVKWPERTVPMLPYTDETSAKADLEAGKIQAYFILSQDYLSTGQAQEFYVKEPKGPALEQFDSFLSVNLLAQQPQDIAHRILEGDQLVFQSTDQARQVSQNRIVNVILPFIAGILFIIAMSTSSGYLMQAVVEEKENRTMEIMVTSVSPGQLMSGKIVADIAVGLTQLFVWGIFIILILFIGRNYISVLSGISFPITMLLLLLVIMLPAFVMISGLMAAVGATVTEASEGQQVMALFTLPIWLPYILIPVFMQNPNSPLAIVLSFFPLTTPMTMALRMAFANIPSWQVITSIIILVISASGAIWLAGRAFRLGMLRYGQRLRWKELVSRQRA
ncbi:MAG: ABC transporter permease [Acidobacteriaceae bacterium]